MRKLRCRLVRRDACERVRQRICIERECRADIARRVSPYLNLRLTGDPALNYYGLVRPQVLANKTFQTLGNEINNLEASNAASANQLVTDGTCIVLHDSGQGTS